MMQLRDKKLSSGVVRLSALIALATVLQLIEFSLPRPMPWAKLGLANMVTLVTLVMYGFWPGCQVAVMRTIIAALILGTFLTPSFVLSISGAISSAVVMGVLYESSKKFVDRRFSLIGISIIGAITHNMTQLGLVYYILVKHRGIFIQVPFILVIALITGYCTGLISHHMCNYLKKRVVT